MILGAWISYSIAALMLIVVLIMDPVVADTYDMTVMQNRYALIAFSIGPIVSGAVFLAAASVIAELARYRAPPTADMGPEA